jgi:hypothetical protein
MNMPDFKRYLKIGIPDEFARFCSDNDVDPARVLYGIMADLAEIRNSPNGINTNGSDERMYAEMWFDRCYWGEQP